MSHHKTIVPVCHHLFLAIFIWSVKSVCSHTTLSFKSQYNGLLINNTFDASSAIADVDFMLSNTGVLSTDFQISFIFNWTLSIIGISNSLAKDINLFVNIPYLSVSHFQGQDNLDNWSITIISTLSFIDSANTIFLISSTVNHIESLINNLSSYNSFIDSVISIIKFSVICFSLLYSFKISLRLFQLLSNIVLYNSVILFSSILIKSFIKIIFLSSLSIQSAILFSHSLIFKFNNLILSSIIVSGFHNCHFIKVILLPISNTFLSISFKDLYVYLFQCLSDTNISCIDSLEVSVENTYTFFHSINGLLTKFIEVNVFHIEVTHATTINSQFHNHIILSSKVLIQVLI